MRFVVYPYKMGSKSGKLIAETLDAVRVYADRDYRPKPDDFIINWGNGNRPAWAGLVSGSNTLLNHWSNVDLSICKTDAFMRFKKARVPTPEWTTHADVAREWLRNGAWVCLRKEIEGRDGVGLVLAKTSKDFEPARLYTKYIPIKKEYRVYVYDGEIIEIMEKRRDADRLAEGTVNQDIRTETNGWVFCLQNVNPPPGIHEVAVKAIAAEGLDFGGVDIVHSKEDDRCYVLETNTAPGIHRHTAERFAAAFEKAARAR